MSERTARKVTMMIYDDQAPGIIEFLDSLPARMETAFIRGLVYQWMLANGTAEEFDARVWGVLDGPGGRAVVSTLGGGRAPIPPRRPGPRPAPRPGLRPAASARPTPAPRPPAAPAPTDRPPAEQIVMPAGDAPRQAVPERRLPDVPVVSPEPSPSPVSAPNLDPQIPMTTNPPPAAEAETSELVNEGPTEADLASLAALDEMF